MKKPVSLHLVNSDTPVKSGTVYSILPCGITKIQLPNELSGDTYKQYTTFGDFGVKGKVNVFKK